MEIVLECSKIIQYDIDNIEKSKFDTVCVDYDTYKKICDYEIKSSLVKVNNLEINFDTLKCKYLAVELGKWSYEEYVALGREVQKNNIQILLVNTFSEKNGQVVRNKFSSSKEIISFIDKLNIELKAEVFGVCVDVCACTLCAQDIHEFVITLKDKIKAIRISGCDGYRYNRTLPFPIMSDKTSSVDWSGMIRGLREINFDGELILDFSDDMKAISPLLVKATLEFSYAIGKYIENRVKFEDVLKKYKSIVLFGAGFMFGVYMNCYVKKYPPLFVCDNNKTLWGKNIRGVLVKNPEELKNISEDTVVIISNSLYCREIKAQLLEMGIKNIEIFD